MVFDFFEVFLQPVDKSAQSPVVFSVDRYLAVLGGCIGETTDGKGFHFQLVTELFLEPYIGLQVAIIFSILELEFLQHVLLVIKFTGHKCHFLCGPSKILMAQQKIAMVLINDTATGKNECSVPLQPSGMIKRMTKTNRQALHVPVYAEESILQSELLVQKLNEEVAKSQKDNAETTLMHADLDTPTKTFDEPYFEFNPEDIENDIFYEDF